ncbi:MAG TPA: AmmeMemoRadiSam system protein B [Dongiaceae bacterium]|nr:AmmeMemoRadiSam system protein B [Dongiaceae bacterium]
MPPADHDPPRPGRIIVPGEESEPPRRQPLVTPGGAVAGPEAEGGATRIVLPPGATRESEEPVPEFPRLRALSILPVRDGEQDLLLVTDPLGLLPEPVALRMESLPLLQMLDGRTSVTDLGAAMVRGSRDIRAGTWIREFVGQLDRLLLLESPRFETAYRELRDRYHQLEVRQAAFAGVSYPGDPETAGRFVDTQVAAAGTLRAERGLAEPAGNATPRLVMSPHLDPRRAGVAIALGAAELGGDRSEPLRIVVIGVGHAIWDSWFALTRKHFETPWGRVACDTRFVDAVASQLGDEAYRAEIAHRDEHSIEFQMLFLRRRFGDHPITLVPILVGGFHPLLEDGRRPAQVAEIETLIAAVRETERAQGGATCYVAAVDLSHVGPRFGDPRPDDRVRGETETRDRAALDAALAGDAEGWFDAIANGDDATRVCGWGATYVALRCAAPGTGRLLDYRQSPEDDGTFVSIATAVWP